MFALLLTASERASEHASQCAPLLVEDAAGKAQRGSCICTVTQQVGCESESRPRSPLGELTGVIRSGSTVHSPDSMLPGHWPMSHYPWFNTITYPP